MATRGGEEAPGDFLKEVLGSLHKAAEKEGATPSSVLKHLQEEFE